MATAVLRSHDVISNRIQNPKLTANRTWRRKRSPNHDDRTVDRTDRSLVVKFPVKNLVLGEVKILKRGEELISSAIGDEKLGLDSEIARSEVKVKVSEVRVFSDTLYAGSAFVSSPPPSSVPFPAMLMKKTDLATSNLRRILGLDVLI